MRLQITDMLSENLFDLERRSYIAWPAEFERLHDGWLFRACRGYSKRANSLNFYGPNSTLSAIEVANHTQEWAQKHSIHPILRLSDLAPPHYGHGLENLGWQCYGKSLVMTRDLGRSVDHDNYIFDTHDHNPILSFKSQADWLEIFGAAANLSSKDRMDLKHLFSFYKSPPDFVCLEENKNILCVAQIVTTGTVAGIVNLVTPEKLRCKGYAQLLLHAIFNWAANNNINSMWLQVVANSDTACRLYQKLGFKVAYSYSYWSPTLP